MSFIYQKISKVNFVINPKIEQTNKHILASIHKEMKNRRRINVLEEYWCFFYNVK